MISIQKFGKTIRQIFSILLQSFFVAFPCVNKNIYIFAYDVNVKYNLKLTMITNAVTKVHKCIIYLFCCSFRPKKNYIWNDELMAEIFFISIDFDCV